jgi:hypothetical protein
VRAAGFALAVFALGAPISFARAAPVGESSAAAATPAAPADVSRDAGGATKADDRIRTRLGGHATVAFGMPGVDFVNELVGARVELEYTPRFALGASLAYANLKGKDGRVSNVLPEASIAYGIPLGDGSVRIPIRFAGGFLPKNGPTLRLTSGFDWAPSNTIAFELALVEPMVWVARDRPELSLNLGAALLGRF